VTPEKYLFRTWIDGNKVIETEKGDITVLELLADFRSHLLQDLEHNKKAYHQKQCDIPVVVKKSELCAHNNEPVLNKEGHYVCPDCGKYGEDC